MEQETRKTKQFFIDCYKSRTPVWIITNSDDWVGGYLNELPTNEYIEVLDWKEKEVRRVIYSNIHLKKEFQGDFSKLPLPSYLSQDGISSDSYKLSVDTSFHAHPDNFQGGKDETK